MSKLGTAKARHALAVRYHGADSQQARETKEKLAAEKTAAHIEKALESAPVLSDEQLERIAALLRQAAS